jgi:hypothetical protein
VVRGVTEPDDGEPAELELTDELEGGDPDATDAVEVDA